LSDDGSEQSPWCVLKFGGSSLATPERWNNQAGTVLRRVEAGDRPLVVLSAVGGTTNDLAAIPGRDPATRKQLLNRIHARHEQLTLTLGTGPVPEIGDRLDALRAWVATRPDHAGWTPRSLAHLMSHGELLSTLLGAAWLRKHGLSVRWLDARDVLHSPASDHPERDYLSAECDYAFSAADRERFDAFPEQVVITQGFLARNTQTGDTVLLGRGGSDTAAAYFASRIGARRLEIWTDVPGLFTANPHLVSDARLIHRLAYDEIETLAAMGATALHPRSVSPVRKAGIPMEMAWTDHPELDGTLVDADAGDDPGIKAISSRSGLCVVSARRPASWQPVGFMADVAGSFRRHGICMDLVSSSPSDIRVTVDLEADPSAATRMDALLRDLNRSSDASLIPEAASVSLVGRELRSVLPAMAETLQHLEGHNLHLLAQSANDFSLTYVTERESELPLVKEMHGELFGEVGAGKTFGPTWDDLKAAIPDMEEDARAASVAAAS
jgi:diaminopimelate decarboxylase/aspartate kinase